MQINQQTLTKEQKQAIGILSLGTFLEYFDLMLYVHMAVLLNDLFFSKTDIFSSSIIGAFAFCSTFVCRPLGALLIGWLGDTYGRKSTIILTTSVMSVCCIAMASLPTYTQIGIAASIAVTACRALQGISSMGEAVGAQLYITELIAPPKVYSACAFTNVCSYSGTMCALFVAKLAISENFNNWRVAFLLGAVIAFVGIMARTRLRETPDFADAKRELHKLCNDVKMDKRKLNESVVYTQKINKKSVISLFLIQLACPVFHLYFIYIHGANVLKNSFGYSSAQVIDHNFIISLFDLSSVILMTYLVSFIHPLKILKTKFFITAPFFLITPFLLNNITSVFEFTLIQLFIVFFMPSEFPAVPIFCKAFPVFKRFKSVCLIFATSRALMYLISSFGIIYLIKYFGNLGLLFLFVPVIIGYGCGLFHFVNLEKQKEEKELNYLQKNVEIV